MQVYETRFKKDFTPICQSWVNEIAAQLLNEVATKALWSLWVVIFKQAKKIPFSVSKNLHWKLGHQVRSLETHTAYSEIVISIFLLVVWLSWNFVRFDEIFFQTDDENFSFLSYETKMFYS